MTNPFRTLRFRLVLLNLMVFGSILIALCVVLLFVAERFLRQEFDTRLADGAQSMVEVIEITTEEVSDVIPQSHFRPRLNPFHFLEYYFQIRRTDGALLERSANLANADATLPFSGQARLARLTGQPVLETLSGKTAVQLLGPEHQLRLLTLYHKRADTPAFYLQVAVSLTSVDRATAALRRAVLLLVPFGLLLSVFASERLVRRMLVPIGRVAREARRLTAAHLHRRLPVPAGKDEVVEMIHTLNDMLERLQAAFEAQERFIANAAHELKTPVTHLLGRAQVLSRQVRQPEEYDSFVASVQDDMRHLALVVESLLLLARADAGLPLATQTAVSINEVVADAVERCFPYAQQREVRIEPTLCPPTADTTEPEVQGDAELLVAMVSNLVRNAIRFSPPGAQVDIEVASVHDLVRIAVRDRGPGIPAEQLPRLFERFYQADRGGQPTGTGLGLAIAQSVAKLHRGKIEVQNRAEGGCEFAVTLPLASAGVAATSREERRRRR